MTGALIVLLTLLAQVPPPSAGSPAKARAQALLSEGTALYTRGDFAAALGKFEAAYALYPSPKLQFNIGQADRELGRPADAIEAFERFLELAPDAAPEWRSEAERTVSDLSGKVGRVSVESGVVGVDVLLDGKVVARTPVARPLWTTVGLHHLRLGVDGDEEVDVVLGPGESRTVTFKSPPIHAVTAGAGEVKVRSTSEVMAQATPASRRPPAELAPTIEGVQPYRPQTHWYGAGAVVIDAVDVGLIASAFATKSAGPAVVGVLAYPFAGMAVHAVHHRGAQAVLSVLLRLSAVGLGAAIAYECYDFGNKSTSCEALGIGAIVTLPVAAMVIDDAFLAREPLSEEPGPRSFLVPSLVTEPRYAVFRLGGTF